MAFTRCSECKKKVSDKAVACPKCGFPINEFNNDIKVGTVAITPAKKLRNNQKKLLIIAVIIFTIIGSFFAWFYGGSQYRLNETKMEQLGISLIDVKKINAAYGELDRRCKLSAIFKIPLSDDYTSNMIAANDCFLRFDEWNFNLEKFSISSDLRQPFTYNNEFVQKYYDETDIKNYHNKSLNDEYRQEIQDSLKKIKNEYCE